MYGITEEEARNQLRWLKMETKTKEKLETENKKLQTRVRLLDKEVNSLSNYCLGLTIYALITSVVIAIVIAIMIIPK